MTKRITEPRKRTRTVQIKFWATPEEKELIEKKMALTGIAVGTPTFPKCRCWVLTLLPSRVSSVTRMWI